MKAVDQYNDPVAGAQVSLRTNAMDDGETEAIVIASNRDIATGRDGSYTFGYTRDNDAFFLETLTGSWDHDGDGCDIRLNVDGATPYSDSTNSCASWDHDDNVDTPAIDGVGPVMGTAMVRWAVEADDAVGITGATITEAQQIRSFDKDTNTIYAGADTVSGDSPGVSVLYYDENDRYNITRGGVTSTSTYAGFERNLSTVTGYLLSWEAYNFRGRAVNEFTLTIPAS